MAFWNKGEDPWDVKPKPVSMPDPDCDGEPDTVLDSLKAWNKERKEEKSRRETIPPPMTCPWCTKEMAPVYLNGGRDGVYWHKERPDVLFGNLEAERLDTDGTFWKRYKLAWHCPDCGKLVLDFRPGVDGVSQSDKDCEDELRTYAEQANKREEEH